MIKKILFIAVSTIFIGQIKAAYGSRYVFRRVYDAGGISAAFAASAPNDIAAGGAAVGGFSDAASLPTLFSAAIASVAIFNDSSLSSIEKRSVAPALANPDSSSTSPSNRSILNAQSDIPLIITLTSLNGSTFNFTGFSGMPTGGTFSNNNQTLSNTTGIQDSTNIATGTLAVPSGNFAGSYSNIGLTGATIINATLTGTTSGDYFTGTDFTTGSISQGNFNIILVTLPSGTVFNIVAGDLGTTGTFTTTASMYAYLTGGLSSPTTIANGSVTQVGSVAGSFNYLGTVIAGGTLSNLSYTGVFAAGASSDANHFNAASATGTVANGGLVTINRTLSTTTEGTLYIADGSEAGNLITGLNGVVGVLSAGTFITTTGYDGATIQLTSLCISGDINGSTFHLNPDSFTTITLANISGTMSAAGPNSISYAGTQIVTGTIGGLGGGNPDFIAGDC